MPYGKQTCYNLEKSNKKTTYGVFFFFAPSSPRLLFFFFEKSPTPSLLKILEIRKNSASHRPDHSYISAAARKLSLNFGMSFIRCSSEYISLMESETFPPSFLSSTQDNFLEIYLKSLTFNDLSSLVLKKLEVLKPYLSKLWEFIFCLFLKLEKPFQK